MDKTKQLRVFLGCFLFSIFQSTQIKKSPLTIYNQLSVIYKDYLNFKWSFSSLYEDSFFSSDELIYYFDSFLKRKWFDPLGYYHMEMRMQREPTRGDFNWIFDDAVLALASPISSTPYNPNIVNTNSGRILSLI